MAEGTVAELGEFGLIARIAQQSTDPQVLVGPGDDCAVLELPAGQLVVTVDVLVEGKHFRRDWSTPLEIGAKAAAATLADIAAMGAEPIALVIGLCLPGDLPASWAVAVSTAMSEQARALGASVVGGDVTAAEAVCISVTGLGRAPKSGPVLRSGATPGDIVAVAGRLGWSAAGLALLSRGFRAPRVLVDAHRVPEPPYALGPAAAAAGATSMIDVSDGLVADARHLAVASQVVIALDSAAIAIPDELAQAAAAYNTDARTWIFTGGEDHALLATFPPRSRIPAGFTVIGTVSAADGSPAVTVDGAVVPSGGGHEHFR